jgi:hypothetical protein
MNSNQIELVVNGKSHFIDEVQAERELGFAHGDIKEVTSNELVVEGDEQELPLFAIRPHQTLKIKAVGGKLSNPGCVATGRFLKGAIVDGGEEAHFRAHEWCAGAQGNGNAWVHITDADGQSKKLRFGYLITKN